MAIEFDKLGWVDRLLTLWIALAVGLGIGLSYIPGVSDFLTGATVGGDTNIFLAVGLIVMMYPPLMRVDYGRVGQIFKNPKAVGTSISLNWIIGPWLMTFLGLAVLHSHPELLQGLVLIGIARCIAMVLIWCELAGAEMDLAVTLVLVNSVLQILLYSVYEMLIIQIFLPALDISSDNGEDLPIGESFLLVLESVAIYLGIPFALGFGTWIIGQRFLGETKYTKFANTIGPLALCSLLFVIVIIFAMSGSQMVDEITSVLLVAVPLILYFLIMFVGSFLLCWKMDMPYGKTSAIAFTAAGNNFELALALAIALYGANSEQALAAVVGPLIEIPVMLILVFISRWLAGYLEFSDDNEELRRLCEENGCDYEQCLADNIQKECKKDQCDVVECLKSRKVVPSDIAGSDVAIVDGSGSFSDKGDLGIKVVGAQN
ncbi:hypothetical protein SARC_07362 [Sphaeroforma arctica JP610]|uniref:Arsenical-resistance protein n=1 Tax=Sphaeroforma arctica JP610 TaxID=667725 RepID=A0A0L0FWD9_9EUKA|nr:hypothetical protein SARC_07362 [Sphaeroforma arctica JP610]KNC80268.1 hypothetical protein SARC_07362 [Sphaeroforma arctica JP610]|eukprot:XP_014154170.1 hypothetical protein SARC_07362 [Sphaeroforma arctica JP610]